jgi:hypothetical protein
MEGQVIKTKAARYGTVIKPCSCSHEYQDRHYGEGMRVHNYAKKGEATRCTVCGVTK